jgi:hypothetical protein
VIYLRRLRNAILLLPIFVFCRLTWGGWIGYVVYGVAVVTAYGVQDWVVRRRGLPSVER